MENASQIRFLRKLMCSTLAPDYRPSRTQYGTERRKSKYPDRGDDVFVAGLRKKLRNVAEEEEKEKEEEKGPADVEAAHRPDPWEAETQGLPPPGSPLCPIFEPRPVAILVLSRAIASTDSYSELPRCSPLVAVILPKIPSPSSFGPAVKYNSVARPLFVFSPPKLSPHKPSIAIG
jgi:hypothetical protein